VGLEEPGQMVVLGSAAEWAAMRVGPVLIPEEELQEEAAPVGLQEPEQEAGIGLAE